MIRTPTKSFAEALTERKLWGSAAAYLVIGFGLIEAAEIVVPRLLLPGRAVDVLLAALFFGFPIAMAWRWIVAGKSKPSTMNQAGPLVSFCSIAALCLWLGVRALKPTLTSSE